MTNSHTPEWKNIRALEDIKALLVRIDARRKTIRRQAWSGCGHTFESLDAIFDEATAMRAELAELETAIDAIYQKLFEEVTTCHT